MWFTLLAKEVITIAVKFFAAANTANSANSVQPSVKVGLNLVMHERHFYRFLSGPSLKKFGPVLGLSVPGPTFMQH